MSSKPSDSHDDWWPHTLEEFIKLFPEAKTARVASFYLDDRNRKGGDRYHDVLHIELLMTKIMRARK